MSNHSKYPTLEDPPVIAETPIRVPAYHPSVPWFSMIMVFFFGVFHIVAGLGDYANIEIHRYYNAYFDPNLLMAVNIVLVFMGVSLLTGLFCCSPIFLFPTYLIHTIWTCFMLMIAVSSLCLTIWTDSFLRQVIVDSNGIVYAPLNPHEKENIRIVALFITIYAGLMSLISASFNTFISAVHKYYKDVKTVANHRYIVSP